MTITINQGIKIMNETTNEPSVEMTAGEMLRNARTTGRRKREIPTIAKQLCIREEFLQALEEGNYTVIPELVYILGFARNYAMELGLDPDEIVNKIKREMGQVNDCVADASSDTGDTACALPDGTHAGFFVRAYQFVRRNWKWFLGGFLIILVAVIALIVFMPRNTDTASQPQVVTTAAIMAEPAYTSPVRERFGTENRDKADVILQAVQESWVKVEDGRGNTVFSRVLVPGDVYYVPAGDKYKGTFGNAGGIDVWVNGKLAPKVGPDHVRKTGFSLAPKSLMESTGE